MPSWNRDSDRDLDAELRAARPEPSDEVTQAIADRVRPRETARRHRFGRLHLALAGGLTALVLTPVVATGFGGIGSFGKATKASSKSNGAAVSKARSGRALGTLTTSKKRALLRLSRLSAGSAPGAAGKALGGGASLASFDGLGSFFGGVFAPQNDLEAAQDEYAIACELEGAIIQENDADLTQGNNTATGGNATSTGGAGGNANTGNTQTGTGGTSGGTIGFGGDTSASSGDAEGGDGGDADADGGDAVAGNSANQTLVNVVCLSGD